MYQFLIQKLILTFKIAIQNCSIYTAYDYILLKIDQSEATSCVLFNLKLKLESTYMCTVLKSGFYTNSMY